MESNKLMNRKKLLLAINMGKINKEIMLHINSARTNPQSFARSIMTYDDIDPETRDLAIYLSKKNLKLLPLIKSPTLCQSSQKLLLHLTKIDKGDQCIKLSSKDKIIYSLKNRLLEHNVRTSSFKEFVVIGADNGLEAVKNLLMNPKHREKLLSAGMTYIGISSNMLPSEKICIVIDIVKDLLPVQTEPETIINLGKYNKFTNLSQGETNQTIYKYKPIKKTFYNSKSPNRNKCSGLVKSPSQYKRGLYGNSYQMNPVNSVASLSNIEFGTIDMRKNFSKMINPPYTPSRKKNLIIHSPDRSFGFISAEKSLKSTISRSNVSMNRIVNSTREEIAVPISVSISRSVTKNRNGQIIPVVTRKTKFDDGSLLIQYHSNVDDDADGDDELIDNNFFDE